MHRVNEAEARDFETATPIIAERWARIAEHIDTERHRIEAEARALAIAGERVEAARILSDFMCAVVSDVFDRVDDLIASMD